MKTLDNAFVILKNKGYLKKYSSYSDFSDSLFLPEKLSEKLLNFYRLISSIENKSNFKNKADFFENLILPSINVNNINNIRQVLFIFNLIKSENLLTNIKTVQELIDFLEDTKKRKSFYDFLYKLGFSFTDDLECKTNSIIENYIKLHFNILKTRNKYFDDGEIIKSIDNLTETKNTLIQTKKTIELTLKIVDNYFILFLTNELNKITINEFEKLEPLKSQAKSILIFNKSKKEYLNKIVEIENKINLFKKIFEERDSFLKSLNKINEIVIKNQAIGTYTDDLNEIIISKQNKLGYFKNLKIGKINFGKENQPYYVPFFENNGFYWSINNKNKSSVYTQIENIALRIVMSLPKGHVNIKLIDEDFGSNFQTLLGFSKEIRGKEAYYDDKEVLKLFDELKKRDSAIIFEKLKNSYPSLIEYNMAIDNEYEPIQLIIINNFPLFFNDLFIKYISNQLSKGSKTGTYFLIAFDESYNEKAKDPINTDDIFKHLLKINNSTPSFINKGYESILKDLVLKLDDDMLDPGGNAINMFAKSFNKEDNTEIVSDNPNVNKDISKGIIIPIGKTDKGKIINLDLTDGSYHGLICGTTGSGKTVLLHQIITKGSEIYNPQELQFVLLDYKGGTAFKDYVELPNARVIAVDADIEFGNETLKFISETIKLREALFRKNNNAKNLTEYLEKTGNTLPVILIIIDEFQVLLEGNNSDRSIHENIKKLLEEIVRLGRSFGINLLLSTQTPTGVKWNSSTMENMAIRIGLRMSPEAENYLFKHKKPIASEFTQKHGKAIYNSKAGVESESIIFNIADFNEKKIKSIVAGLKIDAEYNKTMPPERTVYYDNQTEKYNGPELNKANFGTKNNKFKINIGKAAAIKNDAVEINMDAENLNNIIIIGSQDAAKKDLKFIILNEFIINSAQDTEIIHYSSNLENENKTKELFGKLSQIKFINTKVELTNIIIKLEQDFENKSNNNSLFKRTLVIIDGLEKLIGFSEQVSEPETFGSISMDKKLKKIIFDGSILGINFLFLIDEKNNFNKTFNLNSKDIDVTISVQGVNNINNDLKLLESSYELKENMAVLFDRSTNKETKFNLIKL